MSDVARPALRGHPTGRVYHADQLLSPLPPGIPPEVARSRALRTHRHVADSWKGSREELLWLQALAQTTDASDDEATRKAAHAGKPLPEPKAPAVREAVGRAERNLALLGNELRTVTGDLFAAAAPHAQAMEAECDEAALAAEESARTALGAAVEALERCGELENRSGWWWELGHEDSAPPFLAGAGTTAEAQGRIRAVVDYLDRRRERLAEHAAEMARFAEHEAKLPSPPTTALTPVGADGG